MMFRPTLAPISCHRARVNTINAEHYPSLLNSLVFYSYEFVDIIRGKPATQPGAPVLPTDLAPNGDIAGVFSPSTNSLVFSGTDVAFGDGAFTIGMWVKPIATMDVIKKSGEAGFREYDLAIQNLNIPVFRISADGTNYTVFGGPSVILGQWNCLIISYDPVLDRLYFTVNGVTTVKTHSGGAWVGVSSFEVCADWASSGGNGSVGPIAIWKRCLSDRDKDAFYNFAHGLKYPFKEKKMFGR